MKRSAKVELKQRFSYQLLILLSFCLFANNSCAVVQQCSKEKVSLDFQAIEVRAALHIVAKFMNKNIVISDAVQGKLSLHLNNVPWDEVLNFILTTQGLAKRQIGQIIMIAPLAEIAARQEANLQAKQSRNALLPLHTQSFKIKYGNPGVYYDLLKDPKQTLLSARGRVMVLSTLNSLIIEDTREQLKIITELFKKMDRPVRQVLIEARILSIKTNYEQRLGVNWYGTDPAGMYKGFNMDLSPGGVAIGLAESKGIGKLKLGNFLGGPNLDLELQAIEAEGKGELISSPSILTSNNVTASIQQGQQIPYTASSASGGTTTQFVQALLRLEVTPNITSNNKLLLDLTVNQDHVDAGAVGQGRQPPINTRKLKTHILINDGQTVVLGGIYEQNNTTRSARLPWISHIPLIGNLFRAKNNSTTKSKLLIFLTPKIVDAAKEDDIQLEETVL